jgi:V/A-type H+-transporting ATPase subunit D
MLKLKQQQLQLTLRNVLKQLRNAKAAAREAREKFEPYKDILADVAGIDIRGLAECETVRTSTTNVAGVNIPVFEGVEFPAATYSLFATPPWVDQALADLRQINRCNAETNVLQEQYDLLHAELTKIIQRVNLFEQVKIPEAREGIRIIRIHLGDEMTAGVGRAKIAKAKLAESEATIYRLQGETNGMEMAAV